MRTGDTDNRLNDGSRRRFVKAAAYAAPLVLTLRAEPAFASYGSGIPPASYDTAGPSVQGRHARLRNLFTNRSPNAHATEGTRWWRRLLNWRAAGR